MHTVKKHLNLKTLFLSQLTKHRRYDKRETPDE